MPESYESVLSLLCSGINFFSAEERVAEFIRSNPSDAAGMTSSQLAKASGSSEATVTRFCKKLGFRNYRSFQLALTRDVLALQPSIGISYDVSLDDIPQSLQNILANKIDELKATFQAIDPEVLHQVITVLQNAGMIQIAAVGNTIPVALDASFKFKQLGLRCVTDEISEHASAFALMLTPADALLLISNSGKSRRLYQIAEVARKNGAKVILITCDRTSPLSELADYILISTNRDRMLLSKDFALSRMSATAVIEVLYYFLLVSVPDTKENILRHEQLMSQDKTFPPEDAEWQKNM